MEQVQLGGALQASGSSDLPPGMTHLSVLLLSCQEFSMAVVISVQLLDPGAERVIVGWTDAA